MLLSLRPRSACVFCTYRLQAGFSTSAATSQRAASKRTRNQILLPRDRDERFANTREGKELRSINERSSKPKWQNLSFKPRSGQAFDRRDQDLRSPPSAAGVDIHILMQLDSHESRLHNLDVLNELGFEPETTQSEFETFRRRLEISIDRDDGKDALLEQLRQIAARDTGYPLRLATMHAFIGHMLNSTLDEGTTRSIEKLGDLRYPNEWFPATRGFQREFHVHVGPTNSGKTYHALKRLEEAKTGLYAGPLRLLAHEVYLRLNAKGIRCNLITGDERRTPDDNPIAPMASCTVEMVPLNAKLDVAVIDEIQMIGDSERGWAWSQAVLGVMAREVHLCGEERTVPIIQEIAAMCGEKVHVHRYERLSPLKTSRRSLNGNIQNLAKGDCVVCFSVFAIHSLRQLIEKTLNCKVAVIYGSLPPETRAQQARLFNDPDSGYDILVASNAIGMGLNLSIRRMVFQTSMRYNGIDWITLPVAEIKQIAGRAGRYSTTEQDIKGTSSAGSDPDSSDSEHKVSSPIEPEKQAGYVTTMERVDFPVIATSMELDPEPITCAFIMPPAYAIEQLSRYFPPETPFAYLLLRMHEIAHTGPTFRLSQLWKVLHVADVIRSVKGLTIVDKMIICSAPVDASKIEEAEIVQELSRWVAESRSGNILDVKSLNFDLLEDNNEEVSRMYLKELEAFHKAVIIWMWMSYRFAGAFLDQELAMHVKDLVEAKIEDTLAKLSFDYNRVRRRHAQAIFKMMQEKGQGHDQDLETQENQERESQDAEENDEARAVKFSERLPREAGDQGPRRLSYMDNSQPTSSPQQSHALKEHV